MAALDRSDSGSDRYASATLATCSCQPNISAKPCSGLFAPLSDEGGAGSLPKIAVRVAGGKIGRHTGKTRQAMPIIAAPYFGLNQLRRRSQFCSIQIAPAGITMAYAGER